MTNGATPRDLSYNSQMPRVLVIACVIAVSVAQGTLSVSNAELTGANGLQKCEDRRLARSTGTQTAGAEKLNPNLTYKLRGDDLDQRITETPELAQLRKFRGLSLDYYKETLDKIFPYFCIEFVDKCAYKHPASNCGPGCVPSGLAGNCRAESSSSNTGAGNACDKYLDMSPKQVADAEQAMADYMNSVIPRSAGQLKRLNGQEPLPEATPSTVLMVPVVLLLVTLLGCLFWTGFGCICNCKRKCCCGGRGPHPKGYTNLQRATPFILYALFLGGIIGAGIVAKSGSDMIARGGVDFASSAELLAGDVDNLAQRLKEPIKATSVEIDAGASAISATFGGVTLLANGLNKVADRLTSFAETYSKDFSFPRGCTDPDPTKCFKCDFCENSVQTEALDAVNTFRGNLDGVINDLDDTIKSMQDNIEQKRGEVQNSIADAQNNLDDVASSFTQRADDMSRVVVNLTRSDATLSELLDTELGPAGPLTREQVILALFAVVLGLGLLGLVGATCALFSEKRKIRICFRCPAHLLHCTWFLGCFFAIIGFVVSLLVLLPSMITSDVCQFTDVVRRDFTLYIGDAGEAPNACFAKQSILAPLGLDERLNFTSDLESQLNESTSFDVGATFNSATAVLFNTSDNVLRLNRSTFKFDEALEVQAANQFADHARFFSCCVGCSSLSGANVTTIWEDFGDPAPNTTVDASCVGSVLPKSCVRKYAEQRFLRLDTSNLTIVASGITAQDCSDLMLPAWEAGSQPRFVKRDIDDFLIRMKKDVGNKADLDAPTTCVSPSGKCSAVDGSGVAQYEYTTTAMNESAALESKTRELQADVKDLVTKSVGRVLVSMDDVKCETFCDFFVAGYVRVQNNMCGTMLGGFFRVGVAYLTLSICAMFLAICAIMLFKRSTGKDKQSDFDGYDEGLDSHSGFSSVYGGSSAGQSSVVAPPPATSSEAYLGTQPAWTRQETSISRSEREQTAYNPASPHKKRESRMLPHGGQVAQQSDVI